MKTGWFSQLTSGLAATNTLNRKDRRQRSKARTKKGQNFLERLFCLVVRCVCSRNKADQVIAEFGLWS